jgi:hypothetical protein
MQWIFFFFFLKSLLCIINVFLTIRQNTHVIWPVKRDIQSSNSLLCKHVSIHLYSHIVQCGLDTLLNLPFKSTFLIYKFILNKNKPCSVFATSTFDLNIIFPSMLLNCVNVNKACALLTFWRLLSAISHV